MDMEQLQKDLEVVQNYHTYLNAKLLHLQNAKTDQLDAETANLIQKAIDGFTAELGWVSFRLETLQKRASNVEVVENAEDSDNSRVVN